MPFTVSASSRQEWCADAAARATRYDRSAEGLAGAAMFLWRSTVVVYSEQTSPSIQPLRDLFQQTFAASEGADEGALIGGLVEELLATTEPQHRHVFVAMDGDRLAGGIVLSRLWFSEDAVCFLLSPVAVHPDFQRQGVGQGLIRAGLVGLETRGVYGVFTYGDPAYYSRVGFQQITEQLAPAPLPLSQPHGWLGQALGGGVLSPLAGPSRCVPAMDRADIW